VTGLLRAAAVALGLLAAWDVLVRLTGLPPFILPGPAAVAAALVEQPAVLAWHGAVTTLEILLGLLLGTVLGGASALAMAAFRPVRRWLLPVLVISQALPVFALAPILVLWFGYGLGSKVAMATLIIFFPVASALHDGLRRTDPAWLDLARTLGADRRAILLRIRLPAALPAFGSGLRVAAAVAPIGAVVGEWVGASRGLGYLMLQANARMQVDRMFAGLLVLAVVSVTVFFAVDRLVRRMTAWDADSDTAPQEIADARPARGLAGRHGRAEATDNGGNP